MNEDLEHVAGDIPGPRTRALTAPLLAHESRNVTYVGDDFPVFWESASGAAVTDVDGNRYIDLTAAFGVANVGHSNPAVIAAIAEQGAALMHGMGDVHPTAVRTRLLERLARVLPSGLDKTFFATTGSEAVEAALKTAVLATGKHRFIAYHGAYHGLSLGALEVGGIPRFIEPFAPLVPEVAIRLDYPDARTTTAKDALAAFRSVADAHDDIAAVMVEPIQGRGGCIVPPDGYLAGLRSYCDARGILLIFDEIYTGFGRTGNWFACEYDHTIPDVMCIGKAMGGGFPISAAVARDAVMDAWPRSTGEALHTSTYLGNPMGCAAALATIEELERMALPVQARELGELIERRLQAMLDHPAVVAMRGRGAMWGLQLASAADADRVVKAALARGVILVQAGPRGDVLSITPPLVISPLQLHRALELVKEAL
ncbi:MAG TPA: aspartate aminotransferase family protein [Candidatus Baltobacteraceae bacterium]|nr:aspartate aminotransferase family protein [Candidatus Baltobacteraceae bacterium]